MSTFKVETYLKTQRKDQYGLRTVYVYKGSREFGTKADALEYGAKQRAQSPAFLVEVIRERDAALWDWESAEWLPEDWEVAA